jgi:GT2 family glycosyltransferase
MSEGFLETFLGNAQRPDIGAVGGRVYDSSHRMRSGAKVLGMDGLAGDLFAGLKLGYTGYFHKAVLQQNFHAVSGSAMMVRREYFLKVGGFSEDVEDRLKDVDLCLKLEQTGLRNVYDPGIVLIEQKYRIRRKKAIRPAGAFEKKWKDLLLEPDGFYNCNLSLESHDYRIRES